MTKDTIVPEKLIQDVLEVVESDLLKSQHYLKKSVGIALLYKNAKLAYDLSEVRYSVDASIEQIKKLTRKIVD